MKRDLRKLEFIDSHTGGEPTRVIVAGFPDLGGGSVARQREVFAREHDHLRRAIATEPRASDIMVGALLVPAADPACETGVIYFNNEGMLHMCGHATIGLVATLAHMGRIGAGEFRLETPVGIVTATLDEDGSAGFENVACYRRLKDVPIGLKDGRTVRGDVAWGGNWFFLVSDHGQQMEFSRTRELIEFTCQIRDALEAAGMTGDNGQEIDHIELTGPSPTEGMDGRNFVLCPGREYDRSPCGTGTSAKLACLYQDGKLAEGETWRQEGIVGSSFEGSVRIVDGKTILPRIKGNAFVTAEGSLILDSADPFRYGFGGKS